MYGLCTFLKPCQKDNIRGKKYTMTRSITSALMKKRKKDLNSLLMRFLRLYRIISALYYQAIAKENKNIVMFLFDTHIKKE